MTTQFPALVATIAVISTLVLAAKEPVKLPLPEIPTVDQVGQRNMPDEIAPVVAPFETIDFKKPTFPERSMTLELSEEGLNTEAFKKAIDEMAEKGGGKVIIPPGEWKTGRIELKSNINLHFSDGAFLIFSAKVEDYQPAVLTRVEGVDVMSLGACIYANGQKNIAITGRGRLLGPLNGEGDLLQRVEKSDVIEKVVMSDTPIEERIYDGSQPSGTIFLPMMISPIHCEQVYIESISMSDTVFWNIVPIYCKNVIIRGIRVDSTNIPRGDGIDIDSTRDVLIEYSTLNCGDDCFTMKAGRGDDGIQVGKPTENVVVRHCLAMEGHGGITCGSETAGWIRNLHIHDCVFQNTGVGVRFKTRRPRGGGGENLSYERIRMYLKGTAFKWDTLGSPQYVGDLARRLPAREVNDLTPKYRNITVKDVVIERCNDFVKAIGIPESPIENVRIENVHAKCRKFFDIADMREATFRNLLLESKDRKVRLLDTQNLLFEKVHFETPRAPVQIEIEGDQSSNIRVRDCVNIEDGDWPEGN